MSTALIPRWGLKDVNINLYFSLIIILEYIKTRDNVNSIIEYLKKLLPKNITKQINPDMYLVDNKDQTLHFSVNLLARYSSSPTKKNIEIELSLYYVISEKQLIWFFFKKN